MKFMQNKHMFIKMTVDLYVYILIYILIYWVQGIIQLKENLLNRAITSHRLKVVQQLIAANINN